MAEQPPLNRIYVLGYSANDRDYPIVSLNADPRVAGYQVPKDLSACPDKRYPNHVFTGAQPISGDERVRHVWEILPSPWVPFTRYDDDLGPIQGRRRSVKNEGQVASLNSSTRTTYEAREGSAIVYTELEESWSIETDEDGNSLFPIRDRDFYDASRGPVQERRQLFVPTGDEVGSLENVNGVITQTSYEPYNEFLSVKIVQTYSVDGPLLIGKATDNEGQLVTVTTQRKGTQNYNPPSPTATRTVEVAREDAESLIERIVDTPQVFDEKNLTVSKGENIPAKFKAGLLTTTEQEIIPQNQIITPELVEDDLEVSQQRLTQFRVKTTRISRPQTYSTIQNKRLEEIWGISIPYYEYISESVPDGDNIEVEGLGDGKYLVREYDPDLLEEKLSPFNVSIPTKVNVDLPRVLDSIDVDWEEKKGLGENEFDSSGIRGSFNGLTQKDSGSITSSLTLVPKFRISMKESWGRDLDATIHIFFLKQDEISTDQINSKTGASGTWPKFAPKSFSATVYGVSESKTLALGISRAISFASDGATGYQPIEEAQFDINQASIPVNLDIPACLTSGRNIQVTRTLSNTSKTIQLSYPTVSTTNGETLIGPNIQRTLSHSVSVNETITIPSTSPTTNIPSTGTYVINSSIEPYKFGWYLVRATVLNAASIG